MDPPAAKWPRCFTYVSTLLQHDTHVLRVVEQKYQYTLCSLCSSLLSVRGAESFFRRLTHRLHFVLYCSKKVQYIVARRCPNKSLSFSIHLVPSHQSQSVISSTFWHKTSYKIRQAARLEREAICTTTFTCPSGPFNNTITRGIIAHHRPKANSTDRPTETSQTTPTHPWSHNIDKTWPKKTATGAYSGPHNTQSMFFLRCIKHHQSR